MNLLPISNGFKHLYCYMTKYSSSLLGEQNEQFFIGLVSLSLAKWASSTLRST